MPTNCKPTVEVGRVLEPAVQAVEVFGDQHLELACSRVAKHLLIARPVVMAAADGGIRVDLDRRPALPLDVLTAGRAPDPPRTWAFADPS